MALDFFAGCLGGCAGVIVGHPLDTVKKRPVLLVDVSKQDEEGNGVAGINAIVFGIYGNTQRCITDSNSLSSHAMAGAAAGFVQSFICSPIELAKSAMQVGDTTSKGPLDCLKQIYKNRGVKGVFRGLNLTIMREVPAFASYFWTYEALTRRNDNLPVSTMTMLMAGGAAGVVSWTIVYPVDVIKSRFQVDGITTTKYLGSYDCLVKSVKADGVICLFRGLTPTVIRAFPVNAVVFTVVTWTMNLFSQSSHSYNHNSVVGRLRKAETLLGRYCEVMISSGDQAFIAVL